MLLQQPGAATSKVICLTEVVSADELRDDEEYEDIMEDMKQEGEKFGISTPLKHSYFLIFHLIIFSSFRSWLLSY